MSIETRFDVEFTRDGEAYDQTQLGRAVQGARAFTDLLVVSHGWNNDMADARSLYDDLLRSVNQVISSRLVPLAGRKIGAVQVFWPSKRFADADSIPGGGAASATAANDACLDRLLDELANDPVRLGERHVEHDRARAVEQVRALLPAIEHSKNARADLVAALRTLVSAGEVHPDDGSDQFLTADPEHLFTELAAPVNFVSAAGGGGPTGLGGGAAASIGDLLHGMRAAVRRLLNFTTYFTMKARAGAVGRLGIGPLVLAVRDSNPRLRIHLVGHSFGGRAVTAAADTLPDQTRAVSLILLQAAYSHNALSKSFDEHHNDGQFHAVLSNRRVSGPVVITHTKNDRAVGIAYPLASRIASDVAAALGDENDPYGGMGRNGAQHLDVVAGRLLDYEDRYTFTPGKVFNLKADDWIKDHNDVTGPQVAAAVAAVVGSVG